MTIPIKSSMQVQSGATLSATGTGVIDATAIQGTSVSGTTGTGNVVLSASPALTGTPTAPTQATADDSTAIATTAYVQAQGYVTASTAPVTSVFGRSGAVVAQSGDYSAYYDALGAAATAQSNAEAFTTSALTSYAPLNNPTFTGTVTLPAATYAISVSGNAATATTAVTISGSITESQVTGLAASLALLAPLASPSFTGTASFVNAHVTGTLEDGTGSVGTSGQVLSSTVTGTAWVTPSSSTAFTNVTTGTNTTATMTVGSGASVVVSGTGVVQATEIQGVAVSATAAAAGEVLTATSSSAAQWQTPSAGTLSTLVGYRRIGLVGTNGTAALEAIGETVQTMGGTQGAGQAVIAARQALSYQYNSASSGTPAGIQGTQSAGGASWFSGVNLQCFGEWYVAQTVTERVWFGLFDIAINPTSIFASDTLHANQYAAFRYSTTAGDTTWHCATCDGTTQNVVSSGVTVNTQSHRFLVCINDSVPSVTFYIDGVLVATLTTHLPTTTAVNMYYVCGLASTAAVTSAFYVSHIVVQGDY